MRKEQSLEITKAIGNYYLKSRDFNGLPLTTLRQSYSLEKPDLKALIEAGDVEIHFGYGHPNPHVKALPLGNIEIQLKTLEQIDNEKLEYSVLYPTERQLKKIVPSEEYENRPFTLMLALGMSQLDRLFFDPQILKIYRDDPRYAYDYSGIVGRICITTESDESADIPEGDKVLLNTFGTGFSRSYDTDNKTCVVAFPYDLHKLTPEHQVLWKHRQLDTKKYLPDHAFVQSQIYGSWEFDSTMYEAFFAELKVINEMAVAIEGQSLFKKDYSDGSKPPRNFHRLLMPTRREYQEFAEILDKMMSDNLNRKFFERRIPVSFADNEKKTITLLEEYFGLLKAKDRTPIEGMLSTFRKVRGERSKSSHHVLEDEFNYDFNRKQRDLMREAYKAIRLIRLAFTNSSAVRSISVPEWLYNGEINPE